jgi:protein-S-isoprenylcysteine O-methyltransferase Ste14
MSSATEMLAVAMVVVVAAGWIVFTAAFVFRKKGPQTEEQKRDRAATAGIVMQMVGYAMVFSIRRRFITAIGGDSIGINIAAMTITVLLVASSVWMVMRAVQVLGKQWSLAARLVKGHELVVAGPYRIVRHPIYTGMMGLLIASGLAISRWWAIIAGLAIFLVGTAVRVRIEERLLRGEFGEQYDTYTKRVPSVLPLMR